MSPRAASLLFLVLLGPALAGCFGGAPPAGVVEPGPGPAPVSLYSAPVDIPDSGDASEPHVAVDPEGRIFVTAPSGIPSSSPLFVSEDGGATWTRLKPNPGNLGGGDTSIAIGPAGEVYLTDLWAGSSSILVSVDHGKTWSHSPVASQVPYNDREWNAVDSKGVAYYLGRTFFPGAATWVSKSVDGGKTWIHAGNPWAWSPTAEGTAQDGIQNGPLFVDPKDDSLAVVYSCKSGRTVCLSTSADQGATWTAVVAAEAEGDADNIFPAGAADAAGHHYVAYAARDKTGESTQVFVAHSPDGKTFSKPFQITQGPGVRLFPWMVAGDRGRVAVAWYETAATGDNNDEADMKDAEWRVMVARSLDALAPAPTYRVELVTPEPIKTGTVSTGGLGGDADRSLGDFFSIALDPQGRIHFAFVRNDGGATTLVHARQVGGEPLYETARGATFQGEDAAPARAADPFLP